MIIKKYSRVAMPVESKNTIGWIMRKINRPKEEDEDIYEYAEDTCGGLFIGHDTKLFPKVVEYIKEHEEEELI